jgi:predicted dienelactone hydrolase
MFLPEFSVPRCIGVLLAPCLAAAVSACQGLPVEGLYVPESHPPALARSAGGASCLRLQDVTRGREVSVQLRHAPSAPGPRPVVVFSHGGGPRAACSFGNAEWGLTLAEAGYLVVHLNHGLDAADRDAACAAIGLRNCSDGEALRWLRPGDVGFVIDSLAAITEAFGVAAQADIAKLAVAGHSFGAYTVMTLAGARVNLGTLREHSFEDPRPRVFLALSPQGPGRFGFYDEGGGVDSWAGIARPVMTQTGAADVVLGEGPSSRRIPFQRMPPPAKAELYLDDPRATHATFNLMNEAAPDLGDYVASAGVAWLDAQLRALPAAQAWLSSSAVEAASGGAATLERK